jgi:hypothetical protein
MFIAVNLSHPPTQSLPAPHALPNAVSESIPLPTVVTESLKQDLAEAETVRTRKQPKVEIAENVDEGMDERLADLNQQIQMLAVLIEEDQL